MRFLDRTTYFTPRYLIEHNTHKLENEHDEKTHNERDRG